MPESLDLADMDDEVPEQKPDWTQLKRGGRGKPRPTLANTLRVLTDHPSWEGVLYFDEFRGELMTRRVPPCRPSDAPEQRQPGPWSDEDTTRTQAWLSDTVDGLDVGSGIVEQAVSVAAEKHRTHPVREYLSRLSWDHQPRIDLWLVNYLHVADSEYVRAVGAKWMISAVARVMEPGCQADYMMILESMKQGIGKSSALRILAGDQWFADTGLNIGDKDSFQALRSKWIYEFGELDSLKKAEWSRIRAFVSSRVDTYRPSYGRRTRDFPRQCVFAGTTNDSVYLHDTTGNRRFWPIRCPDEPIDLKGLAADRNQLWAEASERYKLREQHYLRGHLADLAAVEQEKREAPADPLIKRCAEWLNAKLRAERGVSTIDLILGPMGVELGNVNRQHENRAGAILRACGFTERRRTLCDGVRIYLYFKPTPVPEEPFLDPPIEI